MSLQYANPLMHEPNDHTFTHFLPGTISFLQTKLFEQRPQPWEHKIAKLPKLLAAWHMILPNFHELSPMLFALLTNVSL